MLWGLGGRGVGVLLVVSEWVGGWVMEGGREGMGWGGKGMGWRE